MQYVLIPLYSYTYDIHMVYKGLMRKKVAGLRLEADECRAQMAALGVNERAYHVQVCWVYVIECYSIALSIHEYTSIQYCTCESHIYSYCNILLYAYVRPYIYSYTLHVYI